MSLAFLNSFFLNFEGRSPSVKNEQPTKVLVVLFIKERFDLNNTNKPID